MDVTPKDPRVGRRELYSQTHLFEFSGILPEGFRVDGVAPGRTSDELIAYLEANGLWAITIRQRTPYEPPQHQWPPWSGNLLGSERLLGE